MCGLSIFGGYLKWVIKKLENHKKKLDDLGVLLWGFLHRTPGFLAHGAQEAVYSAVRHAMGNESCEHFVLRKMFQWDFPKR